MRSTTTLIRILLLVSLATGQTTALLAQQSVFTHFITKDGTRLMDGSEEYRFLGLAAANLHQNEDQVKPDFSNRFPDEFEIRDVLTTVRSMGGCATRSFTLTVRQKGNPLPTYIVGIRQYNEDAFKTLDKILQLCNEIGIRLIFPIIDSHDFFGVGGIKQLAEFRGKNVEEFWTDARLRQDYKDIVADLVNRTNTFTGITYKDDKAFLAWQLGNELETFVWDYKRDPKVWFPTMTRWSAEMAAYIKSIDANHLVMDGGGGDWNEMLKDPNLEIMSKHYYVHWSGEKDVYQWNRKDKELANRHSKVLIADEFGLGKTENLLDLMNEIIANGTSGGLLWGIRSHRRDGGFYWHDEGGGYKSYHWPGFPSGSFQDEKVLLDILCSKAYEIRRIPAERRTPPMAPVLLPIMEGKISWQGSAGASGYDIQRTTGEGNDWITVGSDITDDKEPPLFLDSTAVKGSRYRVSAKNVAGVSPMSNIVEPTR